MTAPDNSIKRNFISRILLLMFGSAVIITIFNFDWRGHLVVKSLYIIFVALAAMEMHNMLRDSLQLRYPIISIIVALLHPLYWYIQPYMPHLLTIGHYSITPNTLIVIIVLAYSCSILVNRWKMLLNRLVGLAIIIMYPGMLSAYWIRIANMEYTIIHLYTLVGCVYANDGFAYFTGMVCRRFKKKNKHNVLLSVSPAKTLAGYIGGLCFGMLTYLIMYIIAPHVWNHNPLLTVIFAIFVNFAAILGDLLESAIKRTLNKKDSGKIMIGRGGVLDTFDFIIRCVTGILHTLFNDVSIITSGKSI